jgi:hypothetical protein
VRVFTVRHCHTESVSQRPRQTRTSQGFRKKIGSSRGQTVTPSQTLLEPSLGPSPPRSHRDSESTVVCASSGFYSCGICRTALPASNDSESEVADGCHPCSVSVA